MKTEKERRERREVEEAASAARVMAAAATAHANFLPDDSSPFGDDDVSDVDSDSDSDSDDSDESDDECSDYDDDGEALSSSCSIGVDELVQVPDGGGAGARTESQTRDAAAGAGTGTANAAGSEGQGCGGNGCSGSGLSVSGFTAATAAMTAATAITASTARRPPQRQQRQQQSSSSSSSRAAAQGDGGTSQGEEEAQAQVVQQATAQSQEEEEESLYPGLGEVLEMTARQAAARNGSDYDPSAAESTTLPGAYDVRGSTGGIPLLLQRNREQRSDLDGDGNGEGAVSGDGNDDADHADGVVAYDNEERHLTVRATATLVVEPAESLRVLPAEDVLDVVPVSPEGEGAFDDDDLENGGVEEVERADDARGGGGLAGREGGEGGDDKASSSGSSSIFGVRRKTFVIGVLVALVVAVAALAAVLALRGRGGASDTPSAGETTTAPKKDPTTGGEGNAGDGDDVIANKLAERRYHHLLSVVSNDGASVQDGAISSGDLLSDPYDPSDPTSNPRRAAVQWMAYDDEYAFDAAREGAYYPPSLTTERGDDAEDNEGQVDVDIQESRRRRLVQRYILAVLYFATSGDISKGGGEWWETSGFLSDEDECYWKAEDDEGGEFDPMADFSYKGVRCDGDGNVAMVSLPTNGLKGTVPPELCRLGPTLFWLALGHNSLTGTIPSCLGPGSGDLMGLTLLHLSANDLTGTVPDEFFFFAGDGDGGGEGDGGDGGGGRLSFLSFSSNALTGTIPSGLHDDSARRRSAATALETLSLWDNSLTGAPPSHLASLPNLTGLFLQKNLLVGSLNFLCNAWEDDGRAELLRYPPSDFVGIKADCRERVECGCCSQCV